jgi:hypothetical protein
MDIHRKSAIEHILEESAAQIQKWLGDGTLAGDYQLPAYLGEGFDSVLSELAAIRNEFDKVPHLLDLGCRDASLMLFANAIGYHTSGIDKSAPLAMLAVHNLSKARKARIIDRSLDTNIVSIDFTQDNPFNYFKKPVDVAVSFNAPSVEKMIVDSYFENAAKGCSLVIVFPTPGQHLRYGKYYAPFVKESKDGYLVLQK